MEYDKIYLQDKTGALVNITELNKEDYEKLLNYFRQLSAAYYTLLAIKKSKENP